MILRLISIFLACAVAVQAVEEPQTLTLDGAYDLALATDQSIAIAYAEARKGSLEPATALTRMLPTLNGTASTNRSDRTGSNRTFSSQLGTISGGALTTTQGIWFSLFPLWISPYSPPTGAGNSSRSRPGWSPKRRSGKPSTRWRRPIMKSFRNNASWRSASKRSGSPRKTRRSRANVVEAGAVTRVDVLRATASTEENRRLLIQAENDLTVKRNTLANLLDLQRRDFVLTEPAPSNAHPAADQLDAVLETAFAHREDLRARELAIRQEQERRKEIRASMPLE